jgi:ankyrin repeat protein
MVNLLVAANADVEQRTPGDANTALNAAAMWGRHACVQALVEAGAKVNATNRHKDTALMLCATECMHNESSDSVKCVSVKCVETLLKAGAFVDLRDSVGNTALMKAVERYRRYSWDSGRQDLKANETIIKLLIDAGASLKNKSELGGYNIEGSPLYELPWMFTRRMAYLWRVFRDGVRARGVVMYWYGEMLKRQHAPGGNGRRRDRDEFVEDCVALL